MVKLLLVCLKRMIFPTAFTDSKSMAPSYKWFFSSVIYYNSFSPLHLKHMFGSSLSTSTMAFVYYPPIYTSSSYISTWITSLGCLSFDFLSFFLWSFFLWSFFLSFFFYYLSESSSSSPSSESLSSSDNSISYDFTISSSSTFSAWLNYDSFF